MFAKGFGNFLEEGGWGMYPTLFFGFFLVVAAVLYLLRPQPRALHVVLGMMLVTLGSGVLGTVVGLIATAHGAVKVGAEEFSAILAIGAAESANNLVLSLIFLVLTGLLTTAGLVRVARQPA
jgi:hypothetical protein